MITDLRQKEVITLYTNIITIERKAEAEVIPFLSKEYKNECLEYPFDPPKFNEAAAIWAAKFTYIVAQLILYRSHNSKELSQLLLDFKGDFNCSALLSADLCLRFLPDMIKQLKHIDADDELIPLLEAILTKWHYSGVNHPLKTTSLNFDCIIKDKVILHLYTERIIKFKNNALGRHEVFLPLVKAQLGLFSKEFWGNYQN